ncbi:3-hydroxybutyryl-CoA dehydrogenase [Methylobacterium isbiliense]|uniref:3-hydroxybutyryl-CoA dehydrogenase n=2 Tax=Methylobacterium isbiliense TaxID=315478 RepID=A0ABQ4SAU6_9HYPH|nr:3-hydroxyacyl-CoA dehydrogenase family protein [Methylobacterium sp.]GJD99643.1 3-hydroxybutyryl-CoA dehydrogenase [Methylobacterium isbiliense]
MTSAMTVGVVGAGLMGSEIALTFALAGHPVVLADRSSEALAAALERLQGVYERGVQRGALPAAERDAAFGRLSTTTDLSGMAACGFVTEAVFEQQSVKAAVFRDLDAHCRPDCILATNTSTIPISVLAAEVSPARRPRFLGTHYFSPVTRMKLVEVIPAFETAREVVEATLALCHAIGKTPIEIKDVAGFAVNRLLHAFMIEAVRLVEEGVATPADIDTACRLGLGHPVGPFELMDATTSSLCLQVQEILQDAYGERFRPRPLLKQRVKAGYVGGRGKPGWRR